MLIEKTVDRESQQKLYVQMYTIIKDKIEGREWIAGSQIPTEDELCKVYDVSKATVRMAIAELVRNGYLKKHQGKGTFVSHTLPDLGITMKTKLTEDMFGEGVVARKVVLVKGIKVPPEDVKNYLQPEGDIYYILCKRVVEGEPAYLEETFVPLEVVPDIEEVDVCQTPFYEMMQQKAAKKIQKVVQMIEITEMTSDAMVILKSEKGAPMLLLHRLLVGTDGKPLAYTRLMGDGKKYKLQTEMIQIA
jgi:DNA-binding GntR family transcriptional regulator